MELWQSRSTIARSARHLCERAPKEEPGVKSERKGDSEGVRGRSGKKLDFRKLAQKGRIE